MVDLDSLVGRIGNVELRIFMLFGAKESGGLELII